MKAAQFAAAMQPAMSIADDLFEQAKAHAECYRAGVLAGDASGRSAQKLAALIAAAEAALDDLRPTENGFPRSAHCARSRLREAIAEARRGAELPDRTQ